MREFQSRDAAGALRRYHLWLQWTADRQLAAAAKRAQAAGLEVGLYRDLALGCAYDGGEVAAAPHLFATAVSLGAPPDRFNKSGQVWNLPPFNPHALAAEDFRPYQDILGANMRHAGALRIDHILGAARQFWVPRGAAAADGAYVTFPLEELIARHRRREPARPLHGDRRRSRHGGRRACAPGSPPPTSSPIGCCGSSRTTASSARPRPGRGSPPPVFPPTISRPSPAGTRARARRREARSKKPSRRPAATAAISWSTPMPSSPARPRPSCWSRPTISPARPSPSTSPAPTPSARTGAAGCRSPSKPWPATRHAGPCRRSTP